MIDYFKIPSPSYVLDENKLRRNLELIKRVKDSAGVETTKSIMLHFN